MIPPQSRQILFHITTSKWKKRKLLCLLMYKSMNLKEKLKDMTEEEQLQLLASDGMLVKRPLLILEDRVLVGFKEAEWAEVLKVR